MEDYEDGTIALDAIAEDELPEGYADLDEDALRAEVESRVAERAALNVEMENLVNERDAWLSAEMERLAAESDEDGFDMEVSRTIRAQAADKGIAYRED